MGKYYIKSTSNNQYRWTFKASNGENIMTSETFYQKQSCRSGSESSKRCIDDKNFSKRNSIKSEPYFVQIANNGEPLAVSEMYSSAYNRDHAISVVKAEAPTAEIYDQS